MFLTPSRSLKIQLKSEPQGLHLFILNTPISQAYVFDILVSLDRKGLILFPLESWLTFSKSPKPAGVLVHSINSLQSLI